MQEAFLCSFAAPAFVLLTDPVPFQSLQASVALFAPVLTIGFFVTKHATRRAYRRAVGVRAKHNWVDAASEFAEKTEGMGGMLSFLQKNKLQILVNQAAKQVYGVG